MNRYRQTQVKYMGIKKPENFSEWPAPMQRRFLENAAGNVIPDPCVQPRVQESLLLFRAGAGQLLMS